MSPFNAEWNCTDDFIYNWTPSRRDGITYQEELHHRVRGTNFIRNTVSSLKLKPICKETAYVYFQRYFMLRSFKHCDPTRVALAAVYLASKYEDHPAFKEHMVRIYQLLTTRKDLKKTDKEYEENCERLLRDENQLLQVLGFDGLAIRHFQILVVESSMQTPIAGFSKAMYSSAYKIASEMNRLTTLVCAYPAHILACVAIYLASYYHGTVLPDGWTNRVNGAREEDVELVTMLGDLNKARLAHESDVVKTLLGETKVKLPPFQLPPLPVELRELKYRLPKEMQGRDPPPQAKETLPKEQQPKEMPKEMPKEHLPPPPLQQSKHQQQQPRQQQYQHQQPHQQQQLPYQHQHQQKRPHSQMMSSSASVPASAISSSANNHHSNGSGGSSSNGSTNNFHHRGNNSMTSAHPAMTSSSGISGVNGSYHHNNGTNRSFTSAAMAPRNINGGRGGGVPENCRSAANHSTTTVVDFKKDPILSAFSPDSAYSSNSSHSPPEKKRKKHYNGGGGNYHNGGNGNGNGNNNGYHHNNNSGNHNNFHNPRNNGGAGNTCYSNSHSNSHSNIYGNYNYSH